ncbi:GNAT family N-acetyltransferase [Muricauda sp. JGD-17]|uniref:GNAT family N-acetyltransferase n=1 Tax=Flagellimonas ochracea TaxID=2696472 RepID=A0A964TBS3_9FLAO|nr:GNAT family N-acetyltransferase [Allomuricauda ochracea]NAY91113.1 GNAT family N-acetyltransferase [Allomuricauda ochracea]
MVTEHKELRIDADIILRPIALQHVKEVYTSFDANIIQFLPLEEPPKNIEETIAFIKSSMEQHKKGTDLVWVILHQDELAGCCGIHSIHTKQPHFGLWVKAEKQGMGIGKKIVHYMPPWGVEHLAIDFIKYPVDQRNKRSIQLIDDLNLSIHCHYEMGNQKKLQIDEYRYYKSSDG